jgi:hypothetical protein
MCPDKPHLIACTLDTYQPTTNWPMRWSGGKPKGACRVLILPVCSLPTIRILIFSTILVLLDHLPGGLLHIFINQVLNVAWSHPPASPCRWENCHCPCISLRILKHPCYGPPRKPKRFYASGKQNHSVVTVSIHLLINVSV